MKARRRTLPSMGMTPRSKSRFRSSGRSRLDFQGAEQVEFMMSSSTGAVTVEKLARESEALLVEQIGAETVDRAKKLFDQQLWLWGQDIARLNRNGLIGFGFERHAPPVGLQTSSCYTLTDSRERRVGLWGFGAFYGEARVGGLFLKRYGFGPCVTTCRDRPPHCWTYDQWPAHRVPVTPDEQQIVLRLLTGFVSWTAEYEQWIEGHAPHGHRSDCLRDWKKRCCGPKQLVNELLSLRDILSRERQRLVGDIESAAA